eukprot:11923728-Ditylum_brightwellii.AAC.1
MGMDEPFQGSRRRLVVFRGWAWAKVVKLAINPPLESWRRRMKSGSVTLSLSEAPLLALNLA